MSIVRTLAVVLLGGPLSALAAGQCTTQQNAVASLKSTVKADQDRIRRLNTGLTANELEDWARASEDEQRRILVQSLTDIATTLWGGIVDQGSELAKEAALQPMDILGYHLPNGVGSLGTGQAGAIIGALESRGITSDTALGWALTESIRQAGLVRDKAKAIEILSHVPQTLIDTNELTNSKESVDAAGAAFQIVADLAGKGDAAAAIGTALFKGGKNWWDAYMTSLAVGPLAKASESELKALQVYGARLEGHVDALQDAESQLEACKGTNNPTQQTPAVTATPAAPSQQEYQQAMKRAYDTAQRCLAALNACLRPCETVECVQSCGNCDREDAAYGKALEQWADFVHKQAQQRSSPDHQ